MSDLLAKFLALLACVSSVAQGASDYSLALGTSAAWRVRQEYGSRSQRQFTPEVLAQGYLPLSSSFWLRPELRVGVSTESPDLPRSVQILERDVVISANMGLLYNGFVVPSLSVGYAHHLRTVQLKTSGLVSGSRSKIGGTENLPALTTQGGIGMPTLGGRLMFDPWLRYTWCPQDWRVGLGYGVDVTLGIF